MASMTSQPGDTNANEVMTGTEPRPAQDVGGCCDCFDYMQCDGSDFTDCCQNYLEILTCTTLRY